MRRRLLGILILPLAMGASGCEENLTLSVVPRPGGSSGTPILDIAVECCATKNTLRGGTVTFAVNVTSLNPLEAGVRFQAVSHPDGLRARVEPADLVGSRTATLIVDVPPGASLGEYTIVVTGQLIVNGAPNATTASSQGRVGVVEDIGNFSIVCDPATFTLGPAQNRAVTCRVQRDGGFALPVDLTIQTPPEFLAVSPTSGRIEANETIEFRVGRTGQLAPAQFSLRIIGRAPNHERQVTLTILMPTL